MPAYNRGDLSVDAYLVRLIAALCRQNGGELRIKGELVDVVGEATALMKSWDTKTQEVVLSVSMGSYSEIYRVVPERQNQAVNLVRPSPTNDEPSTAPTSRHSSTLEEDHERLIKLENELRRRKIAAILTDDLRKTKTQGGQYVR